MLTVEEMAARVKIREPIADLASPGASISDVTADVNPTDNVIDMAARIAARAAVLTAAGGQSWKWQLRDRLGQWIEMGSKVRWMAGGRARTGTIIGSPKEGTAKVRDDDDQSEFTMPANRLTAVDVPSVGDKVKWTESGRVRTGVVTGQDGKGRLEILDDDSKAEVAKTVSDAKSIIVIEKGKGKSAPKSKGSSQPEPDTVPEPKPQEAKGKIAASGGMPQEQQDQLSVDKWEEPAPTGDPKQDAFGKKAWNGGISELRDADGQVRPGRPNGDGSAADPIYVGRDLAKARELILQGKHVRLESRQDLIRLLSKDLEETIRSTGLSKKVNMCLVTVPDTSLFCSETKGITRVNMPQLGGKDKEGTDKNVQPWAEEMLEGMKLIDPPEDVDPNTLAASQNELVTEQIIGMKESAKNWIVMTRDAEELRAAGKTAEADAMIADRDEKAKHPIKTGIMAIGQLTDVILVTHDGYIIDGHHRWAALTLLNEDLAAQGIEPIPMQVRRVRMEIGEALVTVNAFADAAGIARKSGGDDKEIVVPDVLKNANVSPEIQLWIDQNMAKVLAELDTLAGETFDPAKETAQAFYERTWKKSKAIKEKQVRSKVAVAASITPGEVMLMDDDSLRMVLKVISRTADSIALIQADPATPGDLDLIVLASASPVLLLGG